MCIRDRRIKELEHIISGHDVVIHEWEEKYKHLEDRCHHYEAEMHKWEKACHEWEDKYHHLHGQFG